MLASRRVGVCHTSLVVSSSNSVWNPSGVQRHQEAFGRHLQEHAPYRQHDQMGSLMGTQCWSAPCHPCQNFIASFCAPFLHVVLCSYSPADLSGKARCKRALQREMRLEPDPDIPLIGFIGRLDYQKGPDLVLDALPALSNLDCQVGAAAVWLVACAAL